MASNFRGSSCLSFHVSAKDMIGCEERPPGKEPLMPCRLICRCQRYQPVQPLCLPVQPTFSGLSRIWLGTSPAATVRDSSDTTNIINTTSLAENVHLGRAPISARSSWLREIADVSIMPLTSPVMTDHYYSKQCGSLHHGFINYSLSSHQRHPSRTLDPEKQRCVSAHLDALET